MKFFRTGIKGGCYNEFIQGKWTGGHWHADSLYLYDEIFNVFDLCTNLFVKVIPNYAHWGVTEVTRDDRNRIVEISCELGGEIAELIEELRPWSEKNFKNNEIFTIRGIRMLKGEFLWIFSLILKAYLSRINALW